MPSLAPNLVFLPLLHNSVPPTLTPTPLLPPTTAPTVTPTIGPGTTNPWGYNFTCCQLIYSPPASFCSYFVCISSFWNGAGYVMQCQDGMFSKSGGKSGSCSYHGGNWRPLYAPDGGRAAIISDRTVRWGIVRQRQRRS